MKQIKMKKMESPFKIEDNGITNLNHVREALSLKKAMVKKKQLEVNHVFRCLANFDGW